MTTITNFLQGNFIIRPANSSDTLQRPIWVLNSCSSSFNILFLKHYMIRRCIRDHKPLIHIDLGISTLRDSGNFSQTRVQCHKSATLLQPQQGKCYYQLSSTVKERLQTDYLARLVDQLNNLEVQTENNSQHYGHGLFIEGIESYSVLNRSTSTSITAIQQLINNLTNLGTKYRQIVISIAQHRLNKLTMFNLQKISTCLTNIQSCTVINNDIVWNCLSTVRRYTGYSNEQNYTIEYRKDTDRIKVTKSIIKPQSDPTGHQEIINALGFTVTKDQSGKSQQIKKMILPHLKKQEMCEVCSSAQGCICQQKIIVLDEQQQDQDDIDV